MSGKGGGGGGARLFFSYYLITTSMDSLVINFFKINNHTLQSFTHFVLL